MSNYILTPDGELYHYGVPGMKWGVRRYQNKDGTLKPAGKKRLRKPPEMYEPGSLTKIPSVRKADKMILNDVRAYKKSLKGQGVMVREGKLGKRRKETALQIKRDAQKLRAEKKAEKALAKIEKQKYKDVVNKRAKEILSGEFALRVATSGGIYTPPPKPRVATSGGIYTPPPKPRGRKEY